MTALDTVTTEHAAWLPAEALAPIGALRVLVLGSELRADTVRADALAATTRWGGQLLDDLALGADVVLALAADLAGGTEAHHPAVAAALATGRDPLGPEGFAVARVDGVTAVVAGGGSGLLYGWFHLVRTPTALRGSNAPAERHEPAHALRMLDHWDNVSVHPVMGQVERGYAGASLFFCDGKVRGDLSRVARYARLLAAAGVNRVSINNVNVGPDAARLLTADLDDVRRLADVFRPWGIRLHLSVTFAAPISLGGLPTADPLMPEVAQWWATATAAVYAAISDFGGYVVKADSEGQPGPFAYGRNHADGANLLARALAPFGGIVHWRAFVYNHRQDWRDRSTDRARAAFDHFAPLNGQFDENVVLQVKYGPIDFQPREPVSPVIAAMSATRLAVEFQVTQEYTGQQRHVCYLAPLWSEVLGFRPWGQTGSTVSEAADGGVVAVSNVGDDAFWTGHPLAQANLYAFGRLAWAPSSSPTALLDEWIGLTLPQASAGVRRALHSLMDGSWRTYESYTAPLGVGFMVSSTRHHYGPGVDSYEYTPWGTYHFADRDGVGVDRTRATGTGFAGQYPQPWRDVYESLETCPDELVLFFHHVPYGHVLNSGSTVIQHIYDTHFAGVERTDEMLREWAELEGGVPGDLFARVAELLVEQDRSAREWRDQINTYFFRKSGVPDAQGRRIF
ncbi:alpha-glucuronidase [Pengzhenrongella sicca]|uniref:Alpha-glucuronidase n=1 Tax=Pengzhenrongella sicca TaxID=2819238 RepID=A0A8A4ZDI7_9MICO|nr:alpha-glucuronidase [Pengzhenrongella sicca]QTE29385.1 alpha-glucuronidase [Pengzhenrongella sicca]